MALTHAAHADVGAPVSLLFDLLEPLLSDLDALFPYGYGDEIRGIHASIARYAASAIDPKQRAVTLGEIVVMNLIYDITAGCTSIVASLANGSIVHGRNLDYPLPGLANVTADVHFIRGAGGAPLFVGTTYLGYAGLLTGMRRTSAAASGLSISINERDHDGVVQKLFALLENAAPRYLGVNRSVFLSETSSTGRNAGRVGAGRMRLRRSLRRVSLRPCTLRLAENAAMRAP